MNTQDLWTRHAVGDEFARQQLLHEHLGLVHFVARQVTRGIGADLEFDELVSAGTLGLMAALRSFEPDRGLAFSTFATPRIRGAILDELRRQDHVPRSVRRKTRDLNTAREELGRQRATVPTDRETAEHLGVDLDTLWRWQADVESATQVSLDQRASTADDSAPSQAELLVADDQEGADDSVNREQEHQHLRDAILRLKEQERTVLSLYYFEELKLHEIADILGLTESRVSQIRSKALAHLRVHMAPLREKSA
jgi:RNA polymerase sigma factor for flagellar operon FliA